jgi:hypothetical protein
MGAERLELNAFNRKPRTDKEKVPRAIYEKVATRMGAERLELTTSRM